MVVLQRYPVLVAIVEFFLTPSHGLPFTRGFQRFELLRRNNHEIDTAVFFSKYRRSLDQRSDIAKPVLGLRSDNLHWRRSTERLSDFSHQPGGLPNAFADSLNESNGAAAAAFECRSASLACGPLWCGAHLTGAGLVRLGQNTTSLGKQRHEHRRLTSYIVSNVTLVPGN